MKFTFPPMEEYTLPNGMRIIWLPDFSQPVLSVTLQIPVGKLHDPIGCEGTAELSAALMLKGTQTIPSEPFAERFEHAGASLFAEAKEEYSILGVRLLFKAANEIVPLFWEMVRNPAFDPRELKRLKKEMLTGLKAERSDLSTIAAHHFYAELFSGAHPAGRNHTVASIKRIEIEHIRAYYNAFFTPKNSLLIVAGSLNIEAMKQKWESLFGEWNTRSDAVITTIDSPLPPILHNRVRLVDKPENSQTTILLGHYGVQESHEQKLDLSVANFILGGGNFSSRLMARIRSEMGRTYGISSQLNTYKQFGVFSIGTSTQNNQLVSVMTAIQQVYQEFIKSGPTEEEVEKAKKFAQGNMAFELEGLNNIVEKIFWLRFYERENSYIESFNELLEPVTATSITNALHARFTTNNFIIIAVGRKSEIVGQIGRFGHVEFFNCRENPLRKLA